MDAKLRLPSQNTLPSYFVVKSYNKQGLEKSYRTSEWACCDRDSNPQPRNILDRAFQGGDVYLIFSVNSCHGWHGYAKMTSCPDATAVQLDPVGDQDNGTYALLNTKLWYKFPVKWEKLFLNLHQEKCVHFEATKELLCADQITPLNKARNYQELNSTTGEIICELIDKEYERLIQDKVMKKQEKQSRLPPPFFQTLAETESVVQCDHQEVWKKIVTRVGDLGNVLLACAFGSQRYNCATERSDMDMFIVYQARTSSLLGFDAPPQTIKNREGEQFDYTVLELHRFCDLLVSGDPRCVETLYLHPSSIYVTSQTWQELVQLRTCFLTKQVCEKYMNDALGAKGIRLVDKWVRSGEASRDPLPQKVGKLFYIIIRLLQNAQHIIDDSTLIVYREVDSDERTILMQAKTAATTYIHLRAIVDRMTHDLKTRIERHAWKTSDSKDSKRLLEQWLIKLRYRNFQETIETETLTT